MGQASSKGEPSSEGELAASESESQPNLLRIPQETRDNIYSFIDHAHDFRRLWVCRQLYNETRTFFYDRFALEIDVFADVRRPHNARNLVRHGQHGGRVTLRPLKRKIPRGAGFRSVNLFVDTMSYPADSEKTWCSFCTDPWCMKCGEPLYERLLSCLRWKVDPGVEVKLYYHLNGELDLMSKAEVRDPKKRQMLWLFKEGNGLPQCKTLIIHCSAENRTPYEMPSPHNCEDLESELLYMQLIRVMEAGSSLEHFEIWLPECIFLLQQTEASGPRRRLKHGRCFIEFLFHWYQLDFENPMLFNPQETRGLKRLKVMIWNDQEKPTQQRVPVRALKAEELNHYLNLDADSAD
ncbi:MAG: hypothetical protein Q9168_002940 [Polycauliona sp. 1 TL-2023]